MRKKTMFQRVEEKIANDRKFIATMLSYVTVLSIFVNTFFVKSPILGVIPSIAYLIINATFLGNAFFKGRTPFLKFALGGILLTATIGLIGWAILIAYNLNVIMVTLSLSIVTAICPIANKLAYYEIKVEFVREK